MAHLKFKVGDRVQARRDPKVGEVFRGLVGTIETVHPEPGRFYPYTVVFDDPPQDRPVGVDEHGGVWGDHSLDPFVDESDIIDTATRTLEDALEAINARSGPLAQVTIDLLEAAAGTVEVLKAAKAEIVEQRKISALHESVAVETIEQLGQERERVAALIREKSDLEIKVEELLIESHWYEQRHDPLSKTLKYAKTFLSDAQRARIEGYFDGWNEATL